MNTKTSDDYRNDYRALVSEAASRFGWTAADLKANCESIVPVYFAKGQNVGQAWVSAAREAINEESERRDS